MTPGRTSDPQGAKPGRRRSAWHFSTTEISVTLVVAALTAWAGLLLTVPFSQPVLGGDFMVFYTFAHAAWRGQWAVQYDWPAFHALQVSLVPTSGAFFYPPSYPPIVPALFAPLAPLTFPNAYFVWLATSATVFGLVMIVAAQGLGRKRHQVVLAALLFPPFIAHQIVGQTTILPLVGFVGGWWALTREKPLLAGLLLSVVAIKPHFGMAMAIVLLSMRLWTIVGGVIVGLALHAGLTVAVCGTPAISAYLATTLRVLSDSTIINPGDQRYTHGVRISLEALVPHDVATVAWLAAAAAIGWVTVRTWRITIDWSLRMSALLLATLLISPHVQAYDAILLGPATLWLAGLAVSTGNRVLLVGLSLLAVSFVVPAARISGVPASLPLMAWMLWDCQRAFELRAERPGVILQQPG